MRHKIYPDARRRMIEIWRYTDQTRGEAQADAYLRGIYAAVEKASKNKYLWRRVDHDELEGVFFIRYARHYIFFRELSDGALGVVSVLHDSMDIPRRLKEDIEPLSDQ